MAVFEDPFDFTQSHDKELRVIGYELKVWKSKIA
jgi:hypothetical protein